MRLRRREMLSRTAKRSRGTGFQPVSGRTGHGLEARAKTPAARDGRFTEPAPPAPPRKRQTFEELRELQRLALKAITRPLAPGHKTQRTWDDGRPTADVFASFIKPNDRLTPFERLQIY